MSILLKKPNIKLKIGKPQRKTMIIIGIIVVVAIVILLIYNFIIKGDESVEYNALMEEEIPAEILEDILPQYKQLERALACSYNSEVFVIVTRGEKPTGGYDIDVVDMKLVQEEDETETLVVYTNFTDPEPGDLVTQVITYPYEVTKTDLERLPEKIEMKVQYED